MKYYVFYVLFFIFLFSMLLILRYKFPYGVVKCGSLYCDKQGNLVSEALFHQHDLLVNIYFINGLILLITIVIKKLMESK
jgi:hypothetical protein